MRVLGAMLAEYRGGGLGWSGGDPWIMGGETQARDKSPAPLWTDPRGGMGVSRTQSSWRAPSRAGWRKEVTEGCRGAKQAGPRGRAFTTREMGTCIARREHPPCRSCCACVPAPSHLTFPSLWNEGHRPLCAGWGQGQSR